MYGPCRSSIGGGRALTPPSRHSLGEPLPHQQADSPQASPRANLSDLLRRSYEIGDYRELVHLSMGYTRLWGEFLRVTTPSATPAITIYIAINRNRGVRLACLIHAASVHPEPGSNSLKIARA